MLKMLDRLRPADEGAAALAAAIDRTGAAHAEAEGRVADLMAGRGAALLAGGAAAEKHEADLATARADAERLGAMLAELRTRHATAAERERVAALAAQAEAATRACEAAGRAIAKDYPKLAARIAALLAAEAEALGLRDEARKAGAFDAAGVEPPAPRAIYCPETRDGTPLAGAVALPVADDPNLGFFGAAMFWPARG